MGEFANFLADNQVLLAVLNEIRLARMDRLPTKDYRIERKDGENGHTDTKRVDCITLKLWYDLEAVPIKLRGGTVVVSYYNSPRNRLRVRIVDQPTGLGRKGDLNARH